MKFDTIIRTIASSLVANGKSHLVMRQKNLVTRLAEFSSNDNLRRKAEHSLRMRRHKYAAFSRSVFPVTAYLLANLSELLFFLWGCIVYRLPAYVRRIWDKNTSIGYFASNPRYNFWLLAIAMMLIIIAMGYCIRFFITDLLFFSEAPYSNAGGALVIEQPLKRTHHIYLFNTAEYWSDTGIDITSGDRIYITASGGFFSNIHQQCTNAKMNSPVELMSVVTIDKRVDNFKPSVAMIEGRENPEAAYGVVLYSIAPEVEINNSVETTPKSPGIYPNSLIFNHSKPAVIEPGKHSGRLKFCINDIYFSDRTIDALLSDSMGKIKIHNKIGKLIDRSVKPKLNTILKNKLKDDITLGLHDKKYDNLINSLVKYADIPDSRTRRDMFRAIIQENKQLSGGRYDENKLLNIIDSLTQTVYNPTTVDSISRPVAYKILKEHRDIWFRDNNGEILLNIIVEHDLSDNTKASLSNRLITGIFRPISNLVDPPVKDSADYTILIILVAMALLLAADAVTGIMRRRTRH